MVNELWGKPLLYLKKLKRSSSLPARIRRKKTVLKRGKISHDLAEPGSDASINGSLGLLSRRAERGRASLGGTRVNARIEIEEARDP